MFYCGRLIKVRLIGPILFAKMPDSPDYWRLCLSFVISLTALSNLSPDRTRSVHGLVSNFYRDNRITDVDIVAEKGT